MRRMLLAGVATVALIALVLAALGWWSQRAAPATGGLVNGRLAVCDAAPHCVCSDGEEGDVRHRVAAIALPPLDDAQRWRTVREVIAMQGGNVEQQADSYLHATFESALFGFVDDLEFRLDGAYLQVRSCSRVGYSDLGANRKRVAALRAALAEAFGERAP